jgi:M6 family metalloprotease-like protein
VDPLIDFRGANLAIVVPPPGTEAYVFSQAAIGPLNTNEGRVTNVMTEFAAFAANPQNSTYSILGGLFWWLHEIMHAGIGFDDHYGDTKKDITTEYGMGHLTMMTPWGGDLTAWEKLKLGFMRESQVQCKTDSAPSTHWIAPSTVQTQESKSVIISISSTKAVVIESLRPGGLFYKHPVQSQGALVYEIDLTKDSHGMGMKISLPIGRAVQSNNLFMASAPLKQGESTITNGYRITVVESGTFGDVVKVEKV